MPAPYGVTPTGFSRPTLQELIALCEADEQAEISPTIDVSADALMGQLNGVFCRQLDIAWEALEAIYNGNDPDRAEDDQLTSLAKLTGTERRAATYSRVPCNCVLEAGTLLESGVNYAAIVNKPDVLFTPEFDFTAPSTGTFSVLFRSKEPGEVHAPAGQLKVIATPVVGWTSVINPLDEATGHPIDDDATLRTRREDQLGNSAGATVQGIRAAVERVEGVESVLPFENTSSVYDANNLPPKSFEMVIWDGETENADENAVAQAIWDHKGSGSQAYGTLSGTAIDANGDPHEMGFSRSVQVPIYVRFDLSVTADYVDADFKQAVVNEAEQIFLGGDDVLATRLIAIAWQQPNVTNVKSVKLGLTAAPTGTTDIPISIRQIARFDTTRVTTTLVP